MSESSPLPTPLGAEAARRLATTSGPMPRWRSGVPEAAATDQATAPRATVEMAPDTAPLPSAPAEPDRDALPRHPSAIAGLVKRRARAEAKTRFHAFAKRTVVAGGMPGVEAEAAAAKAEIRQLRDEVAALHAELMPLSVELRLGRREVRDRVEVNRLNGELLKGEVRKMEHLVEELGMAFAPATGIAGAGKRFAELREAVNGLERRLRNLSLPGGRAADIAAGDTLPDAADGAAAVPAPRGADRSTAVSASSVTMPEAPSSVLFNYVGFERRFRGSPEEILANLTERYADRLEAHQPVVDIGCGRGELLELLAGRGADVVGVEPDPGMVAEGRARGVRIEQAFAGDYLRGVADHSLGSVFSAHVVEHLELDVLIEMLELSIAKLEPGGLFIAETPNPASLIVLGNSYILDPTHVWPLHPSLLAFLCESAGFRDVRLEFHAPATSYHLAPVESRSDPALAEQVNAAFGQLNEVLFGPQEYAVIATTPTAD